MESELFIILIILLGINTLLWVVTTQMRQRSELEMKDKQSEVNVKMSVLENDIYRMRGHFLDLQDDLFSMRNDISKLNKNKEVSNE